MLWARFSRGCAATKAGVTALAWRLVVFDIFTDSSSSSDARNAKLVCVHWLALRPIPKRLAT